MSKMFPKREELQEFVRQTEKEIALKQEGRIRQDQRELDKVQKFRIDRPTTKKDRE